LVCISMGAQVNRLMSALAVMMLAVSAANAAEAEIDRLVRSICADAKTDAEAADKVLQAADQLTDDAGQQAQLRREAYELGMKGRGGYATAVRAAQALWKTDVANRAEWQEKVLVACRLDLKAASRQEKRAKGKSLLSRLVEFADRSATGGDWAEAERLYSEAARIVKYYSPSRQPEVSGKLGRARAKAAQFRQIDQLRKQLAKESSNLVVREKLIRLYIVELDDPAEARKLLNDEVSEELLTYVPMAAADPDKFQDGSSIELADWYRALGREAKAPDGKANVLARAKTYYEIFLSGHKTRDIRWVKANTSLAQVTKELRLLGRLPKEKPDLAKGCVLYLPFDRETFTTTAGKSIARDLSGKGGNGTVYGAKYTKGRVNGALGFDGVNDCVGLPPGLLGLKSPVTVCLWAYARRGVASPYAAVFSKEETGGYGISRNPAGRWYFTVYCGGRYQSAVDTAAAKADQWVHLVGTWDGQEVRLYVDGKLKSRIATSGSLKGTGVAAMIGANPGGTRRGFFKGMVDEVAVFDRVLSQDEIRALHELGEHGKPLIAR